MSDQDMDLAPQDDMCPNCVTPWKCNGPHLPHPDERGDPESAPDAPATPQVGEVWEDTSDGEQVRVSFKGHPHRCEVVVPGEIGVTPIGGTVYRGLDPADGWRRVSPAPAPLTERERVVADGLRAIAMTEGEVTAEAEAQGVEPASDRRLKMLEGAARATQARGAYFSADEMRVVIARVRAEQARADEMRVVIARVRAEQARAAQIHNDNLHLLERLTEQRQRAEKAEAQVDLMAPVVAEAMGWKERWSTTNAALHNAVRAYREATRGE